MKAPVPPAQEPFIRTSVPFVKNKILASSPPSSMIQSVPGFKRFAATRSANTSWTKLTPQLSARPIPAEPEIAKYAFLPFKYVSFKDVNSSRVFSRM